MRSGQGFTSSLNFPDFSSWGFHPQGMKFQLLYPGLGGWHLHPASIPRPPDFHCTMLSQGKEMWKIAICLCRDWNIHSVSCIAPAVFISRTWGLRLFEGTCVEGLGSVAWLFWAAAHLMTLWTPQLSNWIPVAIPASSVSPVETLKPEGNFFFFCVTSTLLFQILFYPFYIQQALLILLSVQAFEKQKQEITEVYLDSPMWHVHPWDSEMQARQPTRIDRKVRRTQAKKTWQSKPDLSKVMWLHLLCALFPLLLSKLPLWNFSVCQQSLLSVILFNECFLRVVPCVIYSFADLVFWPSPPVTCHLLGPPPQYYMWAHLITARIQDWSHSLEFTAYQGEPPVLCPSMRGLQCIIAKVLSGLKNIRMLGLSH